MKSADRDMEHQPSSGDDLAQATLRQRVALTPMPTEAIATSVPIRTLKKLPDAIEGHTHINENEGGIFPFPMCESPSGRSSTMKIPVYIEKKDVKKGSLVDIYHLCRGKPVEIGG